MVVVVVAVVAVVVGLGLAVAAAAKILLNPTPTNSAAVDAAAAAAAHVVMDEVHFQSLLKQQTTASVGNALLRRHNGHADAAALVEARCRQYL